jgi:hypothetical protein
MRFDVSNLAAFQRDFFAAVTSADPPIDPGLKVHHDTWFFGLIDTLAAVYPAVSAVLGAKVFKAFARDYVRTYPLKSGDRNSYGAEFAGFLTSHPHLPIDWLPALTRYEQALHLAGYADDAVPASFEALLDPDARVILHPSASLIHLDHDIAAVHAAALTGTVLPEVASVICDRLIGRAPDDATVELCLAPLEAGFLAHIVATGQLAPALEALKPTTDDMHLLQSLLARLVRHGLLIRQ